MPCALSRAAFLSHQAVVVAVVVVVVDQTRPRPDPKIQAWMARGLDVGTVPLFSFRVSLCFPLGTKQVGCLFLSLELSCDVQHTC